MASPSTPLPASARRPATRAAIVMWYGDSADSGDDNPLLCGAPGFLLLLFLLSFGKYVEMETGRIPLTHMHTYTYAGSNQTDATVWARACASHADAANRPSQSRHTSTLLDRARRFFHLGQLSHGTHKVHVRRRLVAAVVLAAALVVLSPAPLRLSPTPTYPFCLLRTDRLRTCIISRSAIQRRHRQAFLTCPKPCCYTVAPEQPARFYPPPI